MRSPLLWLSGVDNEILSRCVYLGSTERIRFKALGSLVLIPAVLSLFSMSYAISTVTPNPLVYLSAGVIWAAIVVTIDRYLVATTFKSSGVGRAGWSSILVRYILAIFVGLAVAHPFTLLWFNKSIDQQIASDRRDAVAERQRAGDTERSLLPMPNSVQVSNLLDERAKLTEFKNCLTTLQQYEQSAAPARSFSCGATTGIPGCERKCTDISPRIDGVDRDISVLDQQIAAARRTNEQETGQYQEQVNLSQEAEVRAVADIEQKFSSDYLARVNALAKIASQHSDVLYVSTFIIVFFVLVDVLPITMKFATRPGEYESVRDTLILSKNATEQAKRELVENGSFEKDLAEANARAREMIGEVSIVSDASIDLITMYAKKQVEFERMIRETGPSVVYDADATASYQDHITRLRKVNDDAWKNAFDKVSGYLKET